MTVIMGDFNAKVFQTTTKRRLYTWNSTADNKENIVRNEIDFILIGQGYKNSITSVKLFPDDDVASDHNPLVAIMTIKLKKISKRAKNTKIDTAKLKEPNISERMIEEVNKNPNNNTNKNSTTRSKKTP